MNSLECVTSHSRSCPQTPPPPSDPQPQVWNPGHAPGSLIIIFRVRARSVPWDHRVRPRACSVPWAHRFHSVPGAHRDRSVPWAHRVRSRARSVQWAHGVRPRARSVPGAHSIPGAHRAHSIPGAHRALSIPEAHRAGPFREPTESASEPAPVLEPRVRSRVRSGPGAHRIHSRNCSSQVVVICSISVVSYSAGPALTSCSACPTLAPLSAYSSGLSSTPRAWPTIPNPDLPPALPTTPLDIFLF